MISSTTTTSSLQLIHPFLNHEVCDKEVDEAKYWLVLHIPNAWTKQKEAIGLLKILRVQQEYVLVYSQ